MNYIEKIIGDIETHSVEGIRECFENGIGPNDMFNGKPLLSELTSEYARSPQFKECAKLFVDYGLHFEDEPLLATLLDNSKKLESLIANKPEIISKRYSLQCAFTPLQDVTLLHICSEFNHINCAKVLVEHGADVNAKAGLDEYGFGGHTAIFHTVNQIQNQSYDMLVYLLEQKAELELTVNGLIWGKGYTWETFIPAVNPLSYAMMGLLPQMHRSEKTIAGIVKLLLKHRYGIDYTAPNVPCKYLH